MWLQREREKGWWKQRTGHYSIQPPSPVDWSGDEARPHTHTPSHTPALIWLGSCQIQCCLVVYDHCVQHIGVHTHTHRIGLQLDFKRCPWVWPHCNKTLNQPHLIYKFRAFILKKNEQRTLKYSKQVAKQALDYGYVLWHLSRDRELKRGLVPQLNVSWECSDDVEKALVWVWKWSHGQVTYCSL